MPVHSAGLIVHRRRGGEVEVLLVHPGGPYWARRDHGAWSIPKGEYDPASEAPLEAARREFHEETGFPAPGGDPIGLGEITQRGGKVVRAWAVEGDFDAGAVSGNTFQMEWPPRSGRVAEFPEADRAAWFGLAEAAVRILPAQRPFLERLEAAPGRSQDSGGADGDAGPAASK